MKIHFIAIGGSAMHNLAIALHQKGYTITGSDDEIFNPAKGRLEKYGLLPDTIGWNPDKITPDLDAVILGMHARLDNPELIRANELGIKVYSYPEFLYEQSKDKLRIVVGGSHGKTTITAMILHVLQYHHVDCDYMVGAQLAGFEVMVKLSHEAKIMVMEGDEYLTSPIDRRSKFHLYKPNVGIISGIAWDHINVFPTFPEYVDTFRTFAKMIDKAFIYCNDDENVRMLGEEIQGVKKEPYTVHPYVIRDGVTYLQTAGGEVPMLIFGKHNMANLNAERRAVLRGHPYLQGGLEAVGAGEAQRQGSGLQRLCPFALQVEGHDRSRTRAISRPQVGGLYGAAHLQQSVAGILGAVPARDGCGRCAGHFLRPESGGAQEVAAHY